MLNIYLYISTWTVFKAVSKLLKNYYVHILATLVFNKSIILMEFILVGSFFAMNIECKI